MDLKSILLCKKFAYLWAVLVSQCSTSSVQDLCMCPVTAVICRSFGRAGKLQSSRGLLSCGSHGICRLLEQGTVRFIAEAGKLVVIKETSTKLIFQSHDFLKTVVMALLDEYSAECMCVFSFQKYFLRSCFWMFACPSSPNIDVVSQ